MSSVRPIVDAFISLLVGWLLLRTWCVEGLVVPLVVPSGSMATALLGTHLDVVCPDCGEHFTCGADPRPYDHAAVCPNCDWPLCPIDTLPTIDGDRLLVFKSAFRMRAPRRWEVAVFRLPEDASQYYVKRVVGLPGETIHIREGELFVNDRLARKGLLEQRALAVLVHDSRHVPHGETTLPDRWQGSEGSAWKHREQRYVLASRESGEIDWLTYQHAWRMPGDRDRSEENWIFDNYGYNQTHPRRLDLRHLVRDVMLSAHLRVRGDGMLALRATDGLDRFELRLLLASDSWQLLHDGRQVASGEGVPPLSAGARIEWSFCDQRVLLAIDGSLLFPPFEFRRQEGQAFEPTQRPLSIGGDGIELEIDDLRVFRDVFYTDAYLEGGPAWGLSEPVTLGADEYFVLGDNSPESGDSRYWDASPSVPAKLLIGKPFLVHFPSRAATIGGREVQVPDFSRIRYIR